jgi:hypothetical protein
MKKYLLITTVLILLTGCQEVFNPNIDEVAPLMVVEGMLSTIAGKSAILVTWSGSFNNTVYNKSVTGLHIYVIDNNNKRIDFKENGNNGVYVTGNDTSLAAKIGNTYTLFIENNEGDVFKSSPQLVSECPKIDNLYINADQENVLTEDAYGDIMEINSEGITVYADTKAILKENNFYLFRWYGYEEHHLLAGYPSSPASEFYRHKAISSAYTRVICTGNADATSNKYLRKNKFVFIPEYTFLDFTPELPAGMSLYSNMFNGILLVSEQYSLPVDAYYFWKAAEDQLKASGKLFDPVSTQIQGNITCTNNVDKLVLGVFFAADVKKRFDYLYINSRNSVFYRELDSLPELWLNSNATSMPKGWIFPPI